MYQKPKVIILNGTSSAGKSSLAKEIENRSLGFVRLDADDLCMKLLAKHEDTLQAEKRMGYIGKASPFFISTHLRQGNNLVIDTAFIHKSDCIKPETVRYAVRNTDNLWVNVSPPMGIRCQREIARGDRVIGSALWQENVVHRDLRYDFKLTDGRSDVSRLVDQIFVAFDKKHSNHLMERNI